MTSPPTTGRRPWWRRISRGARETAAALAVVVFAVPFTPAGVAVGVPAGELLGLLAGAGVLIVLVLLRRRVPLTALVATTGALAATVPGGAPAALLVLASVSARWTWSRALLAGAAVLAAWIVAVSVVGVGPPPWRSPDGVLLAGLVAAAVGTAVVVGRYVGARRELLASAQERARRAEAEADLRAALARDRERVRISREMHDVLAHRLSVLALQAGALEYRADAAGGQVARAAGVVRDNAHQALQELRDVLGVLRAESDDDAPATAGPAEDEPTSGLHPQPALTDVARLVTEAAAVGGAEVRLSVDGDLAAVHPAAGRAAYRIVQEGLTNARKHAPGGHVAVQLTATGAAVELQVDNAAPPAAASPPAPGQDGMPGAGAGLLGVAERVQLLGGQLEHGPTAWGGYRLRAQLPPPETADRAPDDGDRDRLPR